MEKMEYRGPAFYTPVLNRDGRITGLVRHPAGHEVVRQAGAKWPKLATLVAGLAGLVR